MATQEDLLVIQQIKGIAGSLRGASETLGKGQQNVLGLQAQQQQGELVRQQQLSDIGTQRGFRTQERQASQAFQQELQKEAIAGRKEVAELRGAETEIKIELGQAQQVKAEREAESANTLIRSGIISEDEAENAAAEKRAPRLDNIGILGQSSGQGKFLGDTILDIANKTESEFNSIRRDENARNANLRKQLVRTKVSFPLISALTIKPDDTKETYITRLKSIRKNLESREVARRVKAEQSKSNFGRPITGQSRAGVQFGGFSQEQFDQDTQRITQRISQEVNEEFGGAFE